MSPLRYQKWLRLNEVRRQMLNEHYDVTTAAYAVGYESYPISVGNIRGWQHCRGKWSGLSDWTSTVRAITGFMGQR